MDTHVAPQSKPAPAPDPHFDGHVHRMQDRLISCLENFSRVLFTTDASGLFDAYLDAFPESCRQHFNCHACRRFIETYGGLVAINEDGGVFSPFWSVEAVEPYAEPFAAILNKVLAAKITGAFYSNEGSLGIPRAGGWTHLAVTLPPAYTGLHKMTLTAGQARAEKREDFGNVMRALDEFSSEDLAQAVRILEADALYRAEHLLGAVQWLAKVQDILRGTKNHRTREALLWRAVGLAPAGFCHPRSGMLGALLEDIQARLPFEEIKRRFEDKMHPLRYQRPQAAPAAATIAQAEKLVEQMGISASLKRRFAQVGEIEAIWRPTSPRAQEAPSGVFGHLAPKGQDAQAGIELPAKTMTWEKFQRTVLPEAESIEFFAPHGNANYTAMTTASDPAAPPILQWDTPEHRNPIAWYVYHGGRRAETFGLAGGVYHKVTAIALQPTAWNGSKSTHHGESVTFCLEGCRDVENNGGLALFPECMKSELHGVRSVIEAFSRQGRIEETTGPLASGIRLQKGATSLGRFRVTTKGQRAVYDLDRWD